MSLNTPSTNEPSGESPLTKALAFLRAWAHAAEPDIVERAPLYLAAVLGVVLVAGLTTFAVMRFSPGLASGRVVTFDVIKLGNAERAVASGLLGAGSGHSSDDTLLLTEASKQVMGAITKESGGALVIIKQAIVGNSGLPDITDAVLTDLGLPTQVPTVANQAIITDVPTTSAMLSSNYAGSNAVRRRNRLEGEAAAAATSQQAAQRLVP